MRVPPAQVLSLDSHDSTVFIGPLHIAGLDDLAAFTVLNGPIMTDRDRYASGVLEALKADAWQMAKLGNYLGKSTIGLQSSLTIRYSGPRDADRTVDTLRRHLRAHRLQAIVVKNHDRHAVVSPAQRGTTSPVGGATQAVPRGTVYNSVQLFR